MVEAMKKVAKLDVELTVEERNLLSVGYKNVIGARRASWRIMSSIEQKEESKGNEENVKRIKEYRHKVEEELAKICNDILTIIDQHLVPSSSTGESTVFYYKMYVFLQLGNWPDWIFLFPVCTNLSLNWEFILLFIVPQGLCPVFLSFIFLYIITWNSECQRCLILLCLLPRLDITRYMWDPYVHIDVHCLLSLTDCEFL